MVYRLIASLLLVFLIPIASIFGAVPGKLGCLDEDEAALAKINLGLCDLTEGWVRVSEWIHAGLGVPKALSLRAYHARSFALSEDPDADYFVCHLAWYMTDEAAQAAYEQEVRETHTSEAIYDGIGNQIAVKTRVMDPFRDRPASTSYAIRIVRGPFLVMFNSRSTDGWQQDQLADVLRAIDGRLVKYIDQNPRSAVPIRSLKEKLMDPSRAPECTKICGVHNRRLEPVRVEISFGLPFPDVIPEDTQTDWYRMEQDRRRRFEEAKREHFPNTTPESVDGGCISDELYDFTWACACPVCDEQAEKWPR